MIELHKINVGHDAYGVDMMHAGIDGVGVWNGYVFWVSE